MKQFYFDGVLVEDANIIHDSTKELFRAPTGAVAYGTEITLMLKINDLDVEYVVLNVLEDDSPVERIGMERGEREHSGDGSFYVREHSGDGSFYFRLRTQQEPSPLCFSPLCSSVSPDGGYVMWYWFEIGLRNGALCYYGAEPPYASGLGRVYPNPPPAFQITVYDAAFATPDWVKSAILYQVFPDRFCMGDADGARAGVCYHRAMGRGEFEMHENWEDLPFYEARGGRGSYIPSDIFGGDLAGLRQKLPYLKDMGVTLLYLNPIFEAASNHRYNTGDYLKIDPILGDAESFRALVKEAKDAGIRIILDGVFSHTGDDSLYFNKYGRYGESGAYQSTDSPYYSWYKFESHPDKYVSWWGFETLPEVDEGDHGWQEFVINAEDSVVRHWIREGASGYRLDVADELPDEVIGLIRSAIKETDPDSFLLGEVWEDATTKQSYGRPRAYALGRGLDSVMNYPFLSRTIEFLTNKIDARLYCRFLAHQCHTYPAPMYYTLMNLVSSHDVSRVRTMLSSNVEPAGMPRGEQAVFALSEEEFELGGLRQRLAAAIQFSLPGVPSIYYGDENGMTGLLDPFNRRAFIVEDERMHEWYRKVASLRRAHPVMSTGYVRFFSTDGSVLGILRHAADGRDFFGGEIGSDAVLTVINPMTEQRRIVAELGEISAGAGKAVSLLSGLEISLEKGLVEIDIPPLCAEFFGFL